jgi:hypothetical protein
MERDLCHEAWLEIAAAAEIGKNEQRSIFYEIGVIKDRPLLCCMKSGDRALELAIPEKAVTRNLQVCVVGLRRTRPANARQQHEQPAHKVEIPFHQRE